MKASILLALFLGAIFVHNTNARKSRNNQNKLVVYDGGPALTCLVFKDYGCNAECRILASAFSLNASGRCADESTCRCTLSELDNTLKGLFRAKFDESDARVEAALKIIREDKVADKVLDILRAPFQTVLQTKQQFRKVCPRVFGQISNNETFFLIGPDGKPIRDRIQNYTFEKLTPLLKTRALQLQKTEYEANMKTALKGKTGADLQSIVYEVRRTKNKKLSDIVDAYLQSNNIKENAMTTKEDTLASVMGYSIIDTFVGKIENEKSRAMKKSSSQKTSKKSDRGRFELSDTIKNYLDDYCGGNCSEKFEGKNYSLDYSRTNAGSYSITWKKGSDMVVMAISTAGRITQSWKLDETGMDVIRNSNGDINQTWQFGDSKTKYTHTYSKSATGKVNVNTTWDNGREDPNALNKYQDLVEEWCKENSYLMANQKDCYIFD